jgi:hypothetical protein
MAKLPASKKQDGKNSEKAPPQKLRGRKERPGVVQEEVVTKVVTTVRTSTKSYSKRAVKQRSLNSVLRKAAMENARQRCVEEDWGAAKYFDPKHPERRVPDCPLTIKHKCALHRAIKRGFCVRHGEHRMLLKDYEEEDIACEVMAKAHSKKPLRWSEVGDLVLATIKKRSSTPKGRAFVGSNASAMQAVEKGHLDSKFRYRLCGRTGMKDFKAEDLGHSRARAANEHAAYQYFSGLQEELEDSGVIRRVAGVANSGSRIMDVRRILNMDEVPQTKNARADAGNATERVAGGAHQERVYQAAGEDRECNTIDACWDLGGFLYGVHIIFGRSTLDTNVIDADKLSTEYEYDNTIDERLGMAWTCDVSTTECGIQTTTSLSKRIKSLKQQVLKRNEGFRKKKQPEIKFPIIILADNHSSRFGHEVHKELFTVEEDEDSPILSGNQTGAVIVVVCIVLFPLTHLVVSQGSYCRSH